MASPLPLRSFVVQIIASLGKYKLTLAEAEALVRAVWSAL